MNSAATFSGNGSSAITVGGSVIGAGTISLYGGSLEQRPSSSTASFGSTSGANDWRFYNLTFSNGNSANTTITTSSTGTGQIIVNGNLHVGKSTDTYTTIVNDNTNDRTMMPMQEVSITSKGHTLLPVQHRLLSSLSPETSPMMEVSHTIMGQWTLTLLLRGKSYPGIWLDQMHSAI